MKGGKTNNRKKYFAEYLKNNKQVRITFSNSEHAIIEKIATQQGLTVASFLRFAALTQARNLYLFPKEIEDEIKKAVRNMRGIGNNINQVAKYCNEQGYATPDSMEVIFKFLYDLEKEIKSLKDNLAAKKWKKQTKLLAVNLHKLW